MASEVKYTFLFFGLLTFVWNAIITPFTFIYHEKVVRLYANLSFLMDREKIIKTVKSYISENIPLSGTDKILVGLSGGADSVALLDILLQLEYDCVACHCNFQLRGAEAVRDRNFAYETARKLGVTFYETVFDTNKYAAEKKISIEMACRELRYEWFEKLRCELGARWIAVAHHRDDSVETMLMNLIRGTGIAGLCGIQPVYGKVIRPLLSLSRKDIEDYLSFRQLSYVVDSTNQEDNYTRNKIRLHVLPLLQSVNSAVPETMIRTMEHLKEVAAVYQHSIAEQKGKVLIKKEEETYIRIEELLQQPSPKALLFEIVREYGFLSSQIDDIWESLEAHSGKEFLSAGYRLIKDRDMLILTSKNTETGISFEITENMSGINIPVALKFAFISNDGNYQIPRDRNIACFDAAKLKFPLTVRHWKKGDRFTPFGMKGSKKLSDYFNDHKYSNIDKEKAWLLCSGDEIIWLIGERISEKMRVKCETKLIFQIICEK